MAIFLSLRQLNLVEYICVMTLEYTIGKGGQSAKLFGIPVISKPKIGDTLAYWFRLDESCIYDHGDSDQLDANKLPGFTDCLYESIMKIKPQHQNSCRIGWRWNLEKECFEAAPYLYVNGARKNEFDQPAPNVVEFQPNEWVGVRIKITKDGWLVDLAVAKKSVENPSRISDASMDRRKSYHYYYTPDCDSPLRFKLYFYFGGNEKAPHPMKMYMRPLKGWD